MLTRDYYFTFTIEIRGVDNLQTKNYKFYAKND